MADIYSGGATSALNEKEYINKIYDQVGSSQKDTLKENYDASIQQLNSGVQATQNQTSDYVKRAYVENDRAKAQYGGSPGATTGANPQAALSLGNQKQANVTALSQQQAAANQEYERQRQLMGQQYASAIKQAQANNDMQRAQALYNAAKAEEEQLRAIRQNAATMMAGKGDSSILDSIGAGTPVTPDTTTPSWSGVTRNEESINQIYDKQMEAQQLQAEDSYRQALSDLGAKQAQAQRTTDQNLTQAYVNALKSGKNYQEVQTAYGQGSGTAAQARLARETGLTRELTDLRKLQLGQDAGVEQQRLALLKNYGDEITRAKAASDLKRVQQLYEAAEREEQNLVEDQQFVGQQLAQKNDYSVLGKLYGLTQDQIDRLQGTGKYAPKPTAYYGPRDDGGPETDEKTNIPLGPFNAFFVHNNKMFN